MHKDIDGGDDNSNVDRRWFDYMAKYLTFPFFNFDFKTIEKYNNKRSAINIFFFA